MSLASFDGKVYYFGSSRAQDVVDGCTATTPAVCELADGVKIGADGRRLVVHDLFNGVLGESKE